jgi:DNA-binding transcriptional MerR regulator
VSSGINERPYLSIGEVLAMLLEEFPDVTISKIRFLESQGLIEPERTASGYRKFFDADIERLRVILREQRENFLPLRVIRDRLETGEIDESGAIPTPAPATLGTVSELPRGIRNVTMGPLSDDRHDRHAGHDRDETDGIELDDPTGTVNPLASAAVTARHPAAQGRPLASVPTALSPVASISPTLDAAAGLREVYERVELCALAGLTSSQLTDLESFGLITGRGSAGSATYTDSDLAIARAAAGFLARGIDARHLRGWRQSAEREAGLFEQRILPMLRQRNPQARHDAVQLLGELADLGAELRQAMIVASLRHHLDT